MERTIQVWKDSNGFYKVRLEVVGAPHLPPFMLGEFKSILDALDMASDKAEEYRAKLSVIQ